MIRQLLHQAEVFLVPVGVCAIGMEQLVRHPVESKAMKIDLDRQSLEANLGTKLT